MAKMIQIRNVPDDLHRRLKLRAVEAGMTLSEFLLREVAQIAERPPVDEVLARIRSRPTPPLSQTPANALRAERDARR